MSYQATYDPVLTGSLNLLPPSALIPKEDAVALKNWRVDQAGALVSRLDQSELWNLGDYVHTLWSRGGSIARYAGAGTALYREGASLETGFDGKPISLVAADGFVWIMNAGKQCREEIGGDIENWTPAAPLSAPGLTGVAGGRLVAGVEYSYFVTYVNQWGEESNPSAAGTHTITLPNQNVQITRPSTLDATITHWNYYRLGNTLTGAYRVNPDPIPIGTANSIDSGDPDDGLDDGGITEAPGLALETDNDPPPAATGMVGPYMDYLIAWLGNRILWTKQRKFYAWPGAALDAGNHALVGEDGDDIVNCTLHPRHVRIYKERSIHRLTGDPGDGSGDLVESVDGSIGLLGRGAIASDGEIDYFQAAEGIYASNGQTVQKVSLQLDPLFKFDPILVFGAHPSLRLNQDPAARAKNTLCIKNRRLYFSYCAEASATPNATVVYDIDGKRWYSDDRGFTALFYLGQGHDLLGGSGGKVYLLEQGQASSIDLAYQTGFRDQGVRDHQKTYCDVVIEHSCWEGDAETSLTVKAFYDDVDAGQEAIGSILVGTAGAADSSAHVRSVFPCGSGDLGQLARSIAIRIEGASPVPVILYSVGLHYYLEPRDAQTFDSSPVDLGWLGTKAVDEVLLDIAASGTVTWKLFTDLPGNAMTQRATGTIAAGGRTPVPLPITGVEGRLVRLTLSAAAGLPFRLYGVKIRTRPIGVWLEGAKGQTYSTLEMRAA